MRVGTSQRRERPISAAEPIASEPGTWRRVRRCGHRARGLRKAELRDGVNQEPRLSRSCPFCDRHNPSIGGAASPAGPRGWGSTASARRARACSRRWSVLPSARRWPSSEEIDFVVERLLAHPGDAQLQLDLVLEADRPEEFAAPLRRAASRRACRRAAWRRSGRPSGRRRAPPPPCTGSSWRNGRSPPCPSRRTARGG